MNHRKILKWVIVFLLPLLLITRVGVSHSYFWEVKRINDALTLQRQIIQMNREIVYSIALSTSPRAMERRIENSDQLELIDPNRVLYIRVPEKDENP